MSIETRHWAWCNLGPLAPDSPATIADSYIQGAAGVITTRGTVTLAGIYRPTVGTPVSFAYSDGQAWIARVPRRLRVLSSTADPLRNITTVSVGCLFALYENRKPPASNLQEAEQNAAVAESVRRVAALPITAAWVTQKILDALGLTAAGAIPFTIARLEDEWDLSAGYVEELGRIAASEKHRCWINGAEQVEFIPLEQEVGIGPLVTRGQIIDLTPSSVGDLPGEAVFARYISHKLVAPASNLSDDEVRRRNWEREVVIGGGVQSIHTYTDAGGNTVKEFIIYNDVSITETSYDGGDRVRRRTETTNQLNGTRYTETTFSYASGFVDRNSEDYSRVVRESTTEWTPTGDLAAACGKNGPHSEFRGGNQTTAWRVVNYDKNSASGITLTKTIAATAYINTPFGADAISRLREAEEPLQDLIGYASRLVPYGSNTRIRTEREFGLQRRPGQQERNREALLREPTTEQTTKTTWALGSPAAEAAIELSPPYVSDDRIQVSGGGSPTYSVVAANAEQQALSYARLENRLLLAHRNGFGLQLAPLDTPAAPFSLLYLRLNGCTAALRTNGTTWTIGADGIVCSADTLFWGAIDGTVGSAWFPLPPGLSSLPAAVAVTTNANPRPANAINIPGGFNPLASDQSALFASLPTTTAATPRATINPSVIVQPWNEAIPLRGGVRCGGMISVETFLPVVEIGGGVRVGAGDDVPGEIDSEGVWGEDYIIDSIGEYVEDVNPISGLYRRTIMQATYSAAEMSLACDGAENATIYGIRFRVFRAPDNQPFPNYKIGAKNTTNAVGANSSGTNGGTFTEVYSSASQTFTGSNSGPFNEFIFDTPIEWTGGNFALVWAWCQADALVFPDEEDEDPPPYPEIGTLFNGAGDGSFYFSRTDAAGCYTITSSATESSGEADGRPVLQLLYG